MSIKESILLKLKEIEEKENVQILFAIESGSRAWGFDSSDSDYDVRFVYQRKMTDYLKLEETKDVIEWQLDEVYDINGWDLKKALKLLHESNPTLIEWCHSPIIYLSTETFEHFKRLFPIYFSPKKCIYNYWNIANKNYEHERLSEQVKLKRYLYILRSLFAAQWIIEKNEIPPIEFEKLMYKMCPKELKSKLLKMVELKRSEKETVFYPKDNQIEQYIKEKMEMIPLAAEKLTVERRDWKALNDFFVSLLIK